MSGLILTFLLHVIALSPGTGEFERTWVITRDFFLDGVVNNHEVLLLDMRSHHNKFVAEYIELDNDSFFEGETFAHPERAGQIFVMMQYDSTYYRVHSGKRTEEFTYEGTWYDNDGDTGDFRLIPADPVNSVPEAQTPYSFRVQQNYPNPFNPSTTIDYQLSSAGQVTIVIYDVLGRKVRTLLDTFQPAGPHSLKWNGEDDDGVALPTGSYFYQVEVDKHIKVQKMLLIK